VLGHGARWRALQVFEQAIEQITGTQRKVLQNLAPLLRHDGLLFAGHSESFLHSADVFRLRGSTVYEPAGPARQLAADKPESGRV